jgi:hypothetical protein
MQFMVVLLLPCCHVKLQVNFFTSWTHTTVALCAVDRRLRTCCWIIEAESSHVAALYRETVQEGLGVDRTVRCTSVAAGGVRIVVSLAWKRFDPDFSWQLPCSWARKKRHTVGYCHFARTSFEHVCDCARVAIASWRNYKTHCAVCR